VATIPTVEKGLVALLKPLLASLSVDGSALAVKVAQGWPGINAIEECAKREQAVVGVTDRGLSSSVSRFWPTDLATVVTAPGIKTILSSDTVAPGGTATLTVAFAVGSSAVKDKDACSLVVDRFSTRIGATGVAVSADDLSAVAQKLLIDIQANSEFTGVISVSRSGAVLTLTNASTQILKLQSNCGNIATVYTMLGRAQTQLQVVIFAGSSQGRDAIRSILETKFFRYKSDFGFGLSNGETIRVTDMKGLAVSDKDTQADVYRADFLLGIEYSVVDTETLWTVIVGLGPISEF